MPKRSTYIFAYIKNYASYREGGTNMPRRPKSLEDQLTAAVEQRIKLEAALKDCESQISNIQQQIEDRNMKDMYTYAKSKGITIEDMKKVFDAPTKKKVS